MKNIIFEFLSIVSIALFEDFDVDHGTKYYYYLNSNETGPTRDTLIVNGCQARGRGCILFVNGIGGRQLFIKINGLLTPVTDQ